jgi:hypothetical protein
MRWATNRSQSWRLPCSTHVRIALCARRRRFPGIRRRAQPVVRLTNEPSSTWKAHLKVGAAWKELREHAIPIYACHRQPTDSEISCNVTKCPVTFNKLTRRPPVLSAGIVTAGVFGSRASTDNCQGSAEGHPCGFGLPLESALVDSIELVEIHCRQKHDKQWDKWRFYS